MSSIAELVMEPHAVRRMAIFPPRRDPVNRHPEDWRLRPRDGALSAARPAVEGTT